MKFSNLSGFSDAHKDKTIINKTKSVLVIKTINIFTIVDYLHIYKMTILISTIID